MKKKTDEEIMAMAGHPDVVPRVCAQWFPEVTQYIEEVYDKVSGGHTVKRISRYGGSIFVTFDDDRTYRVNINKYDSIITLDEIQKDYENVSYLATTLEYDHQRSLKYDLLRRAEYLKSTLDEQ